MNDITTAALAATVVRGVHPVDEAEAVFIATATTTATATTIATDDPILHGVDEEVGITTTDADPTDPSTMIHATEVHIDRRKETEDPILHPVNNPNRRWTKYNNSGARSLHFRRSSI